MTKREVEDKYLGKTIRIIHMSGEEDYDGKVGKVEHVDSLLQLHGTWGGLAVILGLDEIEILG